MLRKQLRPRASETVRILIADADADTRALYRRMLEPHGYVVAEADDGPSALVAALSEPLALIVTDARLPIFDGYALCGVLRDDPATRTTPVIVVTAEAIDSAQALGSTVRANLVVQKPVRLEVLLDEVARLLDPEHGESTPAPNTVVARIDDAPREWRKNKKKLWAHDHCVTTTPPTPPPALRCRLCDQPLVYDHSFVG